jgi:HD-GYP domain-containing protein (c-di-GMP phosphodiesterase class II)
LGGLSQGRSLDASHIRSIVERFLQTLVVDRNIVLGVSVQKAPSSDDYLSHHALNVCLVSLAIAASYGYNEKQVIEIGMAGLLHDVGMMLVPEAIRSKGERLSSDEWFEVQKHPIIGLHLLEKVNRLPESVMIVAYQSHERENGSGYPRQRAGRLIHSYAKIVSLSDIYEAVSSPRTYREANAPYKGMEMLIKMARQGFVNSDFVKAFLMYASLFPVGSIVGLSDGSIAKVVSANGRAFTKPWVSVLVAPDGQRLSEREIYQLDLHNNPDTQIVTSYPCDTFGTVGVLEGF